MIGKSQEWNSRILLVDDDERMHGLFKRILKTPSCRVPLRGDGLMLNVPAFELRSAFQGAQALESVQAANAAGMPFAMVFMDMEMPPGWDGIETILQIGQADPDVEFAVCTGHWNDQREKRLRAIQGPRDIAVVPKPFHNAEIHQLASRLVTRWNTAKSRCMGFTPAAKPLGEPSTALCR